MKKTILLALLVLMGVGFVYAQTRVTGKVTNADDGSPLPFVTVTVKGTSIVASTGNDGSYVIDVPSENSTLVFSFVGMNALEIQVGSRSIIDAALESDATALDEAMVVAYGVTKKSSFTGSAATLKSEELQKRKVTNVTKALDGLAPGVQVTSGSGQPGSGSSVYIRGLGSINASNTPLYVVDGVPYDGSISDINPNDIENMTVLKDASAGALYGSRGANGVVMITTKRGNEGAPEVTFKANFGISSRAIPRYKTMDSRKFIEAVYSSFYNEEISNGTSPSAAGAKALQAMSSGAQAIFGANEQYNPFNYNIADLIDTNTGLIRSDANLLWEDDWLDEVTNNNAFRHEYVVGINGGSKTTKYTMSLGYLNEDGVLETTNFQRYTGKVGVDITPKEWFRTGFNTNLAHALSNSLEATGSSTSNVWYSAMLMGPIFPVYVRDRDNNGNYVLDVFGKKQFDYGENRPTGQQADFNSIATLYDDKYETTRNSASGNAYMSLGDVKDTWAEGLKLTANFGANYNNSKRLTYYNPYFGNAASSDGRVMKRHANTLSYTFNQLLTYDRIFGEHHIDVLAGHEWYEYEYDYAYGEKTGFPFGGLYEPGAATTVADVTGFKYDYTIESFFGRINYDYQDKYYFSASLRRDGSSRFQKDHRWGTFWSIGGNYRISEEDFMNNISWLDNLAVRASFGEQGNDMLLTVRTEDGRTFNGQDFYPWQGLYDLGYPNANEGGAIMSKVQNPELTWENSQNLNIGLDASLFKRLHIGIEWFNRKTTDLLLEYPLAMSSGFEGYNRNSGEMRNRGFEFTISGQILKTRDFEWNATILGTTMKNKVLKLTDDGADILSGNTIIREDEPLYSYYLIRSAGVDPLTGEPLYWATVDPQGNDVDPYITTNSTYALASRYVAGDRYADFYGSISTQLRYKNFDLSISTNYSIGGEMIDNVYEALMSFSYAAQAKHKNMERAWKKPGDISDIPKYAIGANRPMTDANLIDASYFAIKNITLGYTLPSSITRNIGFKDIRFYAAVDNLWLFTHLKGMDPQYSISGGTGYVYTPTRTVSFGFDLKF